MRALNWLWRGFLFVVLFAFALKNQHPVDLRWFFGYQWQAPMIFIVLAVFVAGCMSGVLAMLPSWWRHRRDARRRLPGMSAGEHPRSTPTAQVESPSTLPSQLPQPPDVAAPRKPAP
jgi:uncharacterized integral membrane protein